jgi:hypothetical protein
MTIQAIDLSNFNFFVIVEVYFSEFLGNLCRIFFLVSTCFNSISGKEAARALKFSPEKLKRRQNRLAILEEFK